SKLENNLAQSGTGGGITFGVGGNLIIDHCEFRNNGANTGGNIFIGGASLSLSNTLIYAHESAYGSVTVSNSSMDFINVTIDASVLLVGENSEKIIKNSVLARGL